MQSVLCNAEGVSIIRVPMPLSRLGLVLALRPWRLKRIGCSGNKNGVVRWWGDQTRFHSSRLWEVRTLRKMAIGCETSKICGWSCPVYHPVFFTVFVINTHDLARFLMRPIRNESQWASHYPSLISAIALFPKTRTFPLSTQLFKVRVS